MIKINLPSFDNWVLTLHEDHILVATIQREDVRNSMNEHAWNELSMIVDFAQEEAEVYVVIFTGGEKYFAAGADMKAMRDRTALQVLSGGGQETFMRIEQMAKPVIAAVGGVALGGGCELALACDIRIASDRAKFGQPEVNIGLIPGAGGTQRLSRLVGYGKAKELIFTGAVINAREALRIGLANKVVPEGESLNSALEMAEAIIEKGPLAVALSKLAINTGTDTDRHTGLLIEKLTQAFLFTTADSLEGINAFLEKREPNFNRH